MVSIATSRDLCGALRRGRQPSRRTQTLQGANQVDYRYNGLGQQVQKFGSSLPTRHYLYNSYGSLVGEYTDAGAPVLEVVKLGDLPIAVLTPAGTLYAQADQLNTVRSLRNSAGVTVWSWDSDPFGATTPNEDPDGDGLATVFPLRFPGQYYDAESGLHYNYHRDYDPQAGQYGQVDPLGVAGGLNVYGYVGNEPMGRSDPLGLEPDQNALARRLLIANGRAGIACWDTYFKESEHSLTDCFAYTAKTDCTEFEYGSETQVNCYKKVGECAARTTGYIKHLLCAPTVPPRTAMKIAEHLINDYAGRSIGYCD